jgi:hypothetical protein
VSEINARLCRDCAGDLWVDADGSLRNRFGYHRPWGRRTLSSVDVDHERQVFNGSILRKDRYLKGQI